MTTKTAGRDCIREVLMDVVDRLDELGELNKLKQILINKIHELPVNDKSKEYYKELRKLNYIISVKMSQERKGKENG